MRYAQLNHPIQKKSRSDDVVNQICSMHNVHCTYTHEYSISRAFVEWTSFNDTYAYDPNYPQPYRAPAHT